MSSEKMARLVDTLIVNTELGKIQWTDSSLEENAFEFSNTESTITVSLFNQGNRNEGVILKIYNDEGKEVDSVSDDELNDFILQPYYNMKKLFDVARRQALGVENILDSLLGTLPPVPKEYSLIEQKKLKDDEVPF